MSFLTPILLFGLPLAALPVIIHLIHLHRRRTVKWAAMMFLLMAQKMNKGLSRLRQILILAFRVLAVAALIFLISRPLAGGWLGLTGGAPDTVMILLDRSASMEQVNPATSSSKRSTGLGKLSDAIKQNYGARSRLVLLDSATLQPTSLERVESLTDLAQTAATDTAADIPGMLQAALDYMTANQTGRTDLWIVSDLKQSDWDAAGGRWEALRGAFTALRGVRFHLLSYPQIAKENLTITAGNVMRRESSEKAELLIDIAITRHEESPQPIEVPVRFVINGTATTEKLMLKDSQLLLQAHVIPLDKSTKRGWGRVELPSDSNLADNVFHFVFDEPAPLRSVIVSDDNDVIAPIRAVLESQADPVRHYEVKVLPPSRAAEIAWDDTALIVWHAALPAKESILAQQIESQVKAGRDLIFLPVENAGDSSFLGLQWGNWQSNNSAKPDAVQWWRNDAGLLANTRAGKALPVGDLEVTRRCEIIGDSLPVARMQSGAPLMARASGVMDGAAYFVGALPGAGHSSLARDGVVLFVMLHRALEEGSRGLGRAQQRDASRTALGADASKWRQVGSEAGTVESSLLPLRAGVVESGDKLVALNRPASEDSPTVIAGKTVEELFSGLEFRHISDVLESEKSLTSEVWRTFLWLMAAAIVGEALLCLPAKRAVVIEKPKVPEANPAAA